MRKSTKTKMGALILVVIMMITFAGCKAFDTPTFKRIKPDETAFLIPLVGQTSKQATFASQELLEKAKVPTKEVQIPHRWVKLGRTFLFVMENGEYRDSATLVVVKRTPVTREWTDKTDSGTSASNQGIIAESKESIAFMSQMNCSAQIDEEDATNFLYRYNSKPLEQIMDTEIRARIESKFVEECAKLPLNQILLSKERIMNTVRAYVIPYFKQRGINITTLGLKGDLQYTSKGIQESIDAQFTAQKNLDKAKKEAQTIAIQKATLTDTMKLKQIELKKQELDNQRTWIEKWDGKVSTYSGLNNTMVQLPSSK